MSDSQTELQQERLVFEFDLDAEPEKVWRAISQEDHRNVWLPQTDTAASDVLSAVPGQEVRVRLRDDEPPHLESVVTFRIRPNQAGGTTLRIVHELADHRLARPMQAANGNAPTMMLAA